MNEIEETARLAKINELAHKAKTVGLTNEEISERDFLRKEFITAFRENARATLERITIVEEDGSCTPVKRKESR